MTGSNRIDSNSGGEAATASDSLVTRSQFLQIFLAVMLPMFMGVIDQTLLATATAVIAADFGGLHDTSWIATAYLLTSAVMVPVYGRLGDRHGRREMLLAAMGAFVLGSLACAAAQSMNQLVLGRALQGIGGGGLMALSHALIGELVPPRQRARFQGYFAMVFTSASVLGPVLGGLVVAHVSWRWLFLANLPLAAFAAWRLARLPRGQRHADGPGVSDVLGLVLFAVGTTALLFGLSSGGHRFAWLSWQAAACLAVGAAAWAVLLRHELRHGAPFLPIDLLRLRTLRLVVQTLMCSTFCLLTLVFYLPVYLQLGMHLPADRAGLLMMPTLLGLIIGGTLTGRYVARTGKPTPLPVWGLSLSAAALLALSLAPAIEVLVAVLGFFAGFGIGPTMPTSQLIVQVESGRERLGAATSVVAFTRTLSAAIGTAASGAIIYGLLPTTDLAQLASVAGAGPDPGVVRAFHVAFFICALMAALGALNASRVPALKL